jgi:predicted RNA binding protein with dsRBD fold (UPF0201 family)
MESISLKILLTNEIEDSDTSKLDSLSQPVFLTGHSLFQRGNVNDEAVFHVILQQAFVGLVNLVGSAATVCAVAAFAGLRRAELRGLNLDNS